MQQFCVATALRDMLGLSNGYAEQIRCGLTMMIESLHRMVAATNRPYSRPVVHALAASLAHTFNERADRDGALAVAAQVDPTGQEEDTTLKYLGTVDDAWPVVAALDRIPNKRERLHDATQVRNYLADRDEVAGVETLTDWFGLEDTLPVRAMQVRAAARAGDVTGALALCRGDFHPYATVTLLLDCTAVLQQQRRQHTPAKLGRLIRKALRALEKADPLPDFLGRKQEASAAWCGESPLGLPPRAR